MAKTLNASVITDLQQRVYALLDEHPYSYDAHHVRQVEKHAYLLACKRHLDPETAVAAALLHDHGRIVEGIYGKAHAKAGANVAAGWLEDYSLDEASLERILSSISCHNQKKAIHHPYAELLKDADSLAHYDECLSALKGYEFTRAMDAKLPPFDIITGHGQAADESLNSRLKEIDRRLKKLVKKGNTNKRVHNCRINIRQLRTVLWLDKGRKWHSDSRRLDRYLKKVFKAFEYPRQLAVFRKSLIDIGIDSVITDAMASEIHALEAQMAPKLNEARKALKSSKTPTLKLSDKKTTKKLLAYKILLSEAFTKSEDIESLHRLRIYNKKIMYLIEEGIISVSTHADYEMIKDIHQSIGKLNDLSENRRLMATLLNKPVYKALAFYQDRIETHYKIAEQRTLKHARKAIFRTCKRWQQY